MRRTALLAGMLCLLAPAVARAQDTYTAHYCQAPSGGPASTAGLTAVGPAVGLGQGCPAQGLAAGPPGAAYTHQQSFGIRYQVPPDTELASFVLYRTVRLSPQWNWSLFRDPDTLNEGTAVEHCWNGWGACAARGDGAVSAASRVAGSAPLTAGLRLFIDCNPGDCAAGSATRMVMHRLDAELSDRHDPVLVGAPSGDLLDTRRAVAGVRSVAFSATDRGGGVYRATLEVDGAAAVTQIVDENGGECREPFTTPVPCRLTASGTIALDTATLPDGVHSVRLLVADATDTNVVAYGPVEITTRNQSPGCDPAVRPAITPVTLRFPGVRGTKLTRRRGRGAGVAGKVAGAGAGTTVYLVGREIRSGASSKVVASALTAADGSFRIAVPGGPSRRLRAGVRARPTDPLLACSRTLQLRTPARVTLRARPRAVRAGARVRLTGRLLGGHVPARGKGVELQAFERGRWRTFESVRSSRRGRYVARYRFSSRSAGRSFRLRARVRPEAAYPFALGHSRPVRVRVI